MWKYHMYRSGDSQIYSTFADFWELCTYTDMKTKHMKYIFYGKAYVLPSIDKRNCELTNQNNWTPVIQFIPLQKSNESLKNNFEQIKLPLCFNIPSLEASFTSHVAWLNGSKLILPEFSLSCCHSTPPLKIFISFQIILLQLTCYALSNIYMLLLHSLFAKRLTFCCFHTFILNQLV